VRVVLFAGTGGVGKTTTAAATAAHASDRGVKTLLMSAGSARGGEIPGLAPALGELGLDAPGWEDLIGLPGAEGLLTLLALHEEIRNGPWDLVVVDQSGLHGLLAMPGELERLLARLLPTERRLGLALRNRGALAAAVDRITAELAAVRTALAAPDVSVRLVMTPEAAVLEGTRRLFTAFRMSGFSVDAVVANRVFPPSPEEAGWHADRVRAQEAVLGEADFAPVPLLRAGYSQPDLVALGRELYGDVPDLPVPEVERVGIDRTEEGFTLRVPIPLARRGDLDLGRRGDDLIITVDGYRRVLPLPSVLRRCEVGTAALREGALTVSFRPDPAEFPARWTR
jgi:arsenite-transporting ATPase